MDDCVNGTLINSSIRTLVGGGSPVWSCSKETPLASCAEAGKASADDCSDKKIHLPALSLQCISPSTFTVWLKISCMFWWIHTQTHSSFSLSPEWHLISMQCWRNQRCWCAIQNFANDSSPRCHQHIIQGSFRWFHHYEHDKRALVNFNAACFRGEYW